jgi:1,2-diacylglycerol 3-alpha-glucosyltransferase
LPDPVNKHLMIDPFSAVSARIRAAIIFINFGPYHLARGKALAHHPEVDAYFIELAAEQKLYPWTADKDKLAGRLVTISPQAYELSAKSELTRKIVAALNKIRPQALALAGYGEPPMRAAARWARSNRCGVVVFSETTAWDSQRRWWREQAKKRWVQRYVDAAVVGGEPHRRYVVDLGVNPGRVWDRYNVVDNDYFTRACGELRRKHASAREQAGLPEKYFLYVGRFATVKNLKFLLRAYRRYREIHSEPWSLVMVGDGPRRAELLNFARAEGLHDVVWPGFRQSGELPAYYAFAGCFILPSSVEPWGLVVNEAMASGLPILASRRCGCAADLVSEEENGFTFDCENADELAGLMKRVAASPPAMREAMGAASLRIISRWTPEIWAEQVAAALRHAVAVKSATAVVTGSHAVGTGAE